MAPSGSSGASEGATQEPSLTHTVLGSAMSGFMSRLLCHPFDTVKARLQSTDAKRYRGLAHCLRLTLAEEGLRGLYRGFGAVAVGGTPAACLYLTSYELLKNLLGMDRPLGHFIAGMGAEAVACAIFVPVDVIKERLQVQRLGASPILSTGGAAPPIYTGSFDAICKVVQMEGMMGVYKGYGATMFSFGPFSALYFLFYEQAKILAAAATGAPSVSTLSTASTMAATATSGALASVMTNPLDLAKLRFQTQVRLKPGEAVPEGHLSGFGHAFRVVYQEGGFPGLFRGAGARVLYECTVSAPLLHFYL